MQQREQDPNDFDSLIPIEFIPNLDLVFTVKMSLEVGYASAKKVLEEDGIVLSREDHSDLIWKTINKYKNIGYENLRNDVKELLGEELYEKQQESFGEKQDSILKLCKDESEKISEFFEKFSISPKLTLSIASFTTKHDNRNMWENYADNYSGFCVEYDFSKITETEIGEDILHIFSIEYYEELPKFEIEEFIDEYIRMKVENKLNDGWKEDFMMQYYISILSKHIDYRAEEEWRYIGDLEQRGEHFFPFINAIYIGKNMPVENRQIIQDIAIELDVPVYIQEADFKNASFKYSLLDSLL